MPNWTGNTVPNYYKDLGDERIDEKPYHSNDAGSLFQTDRGWEREIVYTDQHGNTRTKRYVEVADRQRQTDLSDLVVTDVRVANATDYSTAEPTVAGATAGDSFDVVVTFNQPVAIEDGAVLRVLEEDATALDSTYKSGNLTNQLTYTFDTSALSVSQELILQTGLAGTNKIIAWDSAAGTPHSNGLEIAATGNLVTHGTYTGTTPDLLDTITASDVAGFANVVIESA